MKIFKLINEIQENIEYLSTLEGDEYPCITIENLEELIKRNLNINAKFNV